MTTTLKQYLTEANVKEIDRMASKIKGKRVDTRAAKDGQLPQFLMSKFDVTKQRANKISDAYEAGVQDQEMDQPVDRQFSRDDILQLNYEIGYDEASRQGRFGELGIVIPWLTSNN